jgi:hypothetical protein
MADFSLVPSGHGSNYTGMLTRSIVFSGALFVFLAGTWVCDLFHDAMTDDCAASGMTIASIVVPNWIAYEGSTVSYYLRPGNSL